MPQVLIQVDYPEFFRAFSNVLNGAFNLNLFSFISNCEMSVGFFERFIIHMMLLPCCLLAVVLAFASTRCCLKATQSAEQRSQINEMRPKLSIFIILVLFPGLSNTLFSVFHCVKIDGIEEQRLVADPTIVCHRGTHLLYSFLAIGFLIIYILCIPAYMFLKLWRNRKILHNVEHPEHLSFQNSWGAIYVQYEPKYYWYEMLILFNKTMMCGGLVVLAPGSSSQILLAVLFMMGHMLLLLKIAPFVRDSEDWSSFISSLGLTFMYLGILMTNYESMEYIHTALNVLPVLCAAIVVGILIFVDCRHREGIKNVGKVAPSKTRVMPSSAASAAAEKAWS
jgi:hypothetical protein